MHVPLKSFFFSILLSSSYTHFYQFDLILNMLKPLCLQDHTDLGSFSSIEVPEQFNSLRKLTTLLQH